MAKGIKANISSEQLKKLLAEHTLKEIALILEVSETTVRRYKSKYNLSINQDVARARNSEKHSKYNYDTTYFEKINSLDKAYLLGFICADGFVTNRNEIGIGVAEKDKVIAEFFQKQMKTNKPLYFKEGNYPSVELRVQNQKMFKDISKYGIIPNKSLVLNLKDVIKKANLTEEQISVFLLGYFDGDGSIFHCHRKDNGKEYFGMNVTGTFETVTFFKEYFGHGSIVKRNADSDSNNYTLQLSNNYSTIYNSLLKIYKYANNLSFCLERKYNLFKLLKTKIKS